MCLFPMYAEFPLEYTYVTTLKTTPDRSYYEAKQTSESYLSDQQMLPSSLGQLYELELLDPLKTVKNHESQEPILNIDFSRLMVHLL